ncbi:MAG: polysaccharide deacetylase family protein [Spirochaetaceae bacterium]|jgi:peptidoglycan/xylan/chitin deacetylase (PgdA/CDA1 family)|nr:polysaccharide deacetylase family protein [Spirochaetaceae bacterium]
MFPDGKMKAVTLSYDDGVEQDRKLVEIINRFGIKATFNLNSGIQSGSGAFCVKDLVARRLNVQELPKLYEGHEIAVHGLTHPHLEKLDEDTVRNELEQDKLNLERIFNTKVIGMAYPFGTFNDLTVQTAMLCGLRYARGVADTHRFAIPQTPEEKMRYQPTCHHNDPNLLPLAEQFLEIKPDRPQVFYLWGHSYEFEADRSWHILEEFCRLVGGRDDIFYGVNAQVLLD